MGLGAGIVNKTGTYNTFAGSGAAIGNTSGSDTVESGVFGVLEGKGEWGDGTGRAIVPGGIGLYVPGYLDILMAIPILLFMDRQGPAFAFWVTGAMQTISMGGVFVNNEFDAIIKHFKIDDPIDPENKFLVHASVESNEMLTVYKGHVTTDDSFAGSRE